MLIFYCPARRRFYRALRLIIQTDGLIIELAKWLPSLPAVPCGALVKREWGHFFAPSPSEGRGSEEGVATFALCPSVSAPVCNDLLGRPRELRVHATSHSVLSLAGVRGHPLRFQFLHESVYPALRSKKTPSGY